MTTALVILNEVKDLSNSTANTGAADRCCASLNMTKGGNEEPL